MSPQEARDHLGVSRRTFQRYVAHGYIHAAHRLPNGHARFALHDVEALRGNTDLPPDHETPAAS